jgi:hypothetical protein
MVEKVMFSHQSQSYFDSQAVTRRVWEQMGLSLDQGGSGVRHLSPEGIEAAYVGGWDLARDGFAVWVAATHFTRHLDENASQLPALCDARLAHKSSVVRSASLSKMMSLAAARKLMPEVDAEDGGPVLTPQKRYTDMIMGMHLSWCSHMLSAWEEPEFKPLYIRWELEADIIVKQCLINREFSVPVLDEIRNPHEHLSILRKWKSQGGTKAQQTYAKFGERNRFLAFYVKRLRTRHARAIFRSNLGEWSSAFLTTVPRCSTFKYTIHTLFVTDIGCTSLLSRRRGI